MTLRYLTDCLTGLRIWRNYARVGRPEIARALYPCARAALVGLPLLGVPGATFQPTESAARGVSPTPSTAPLPLLGAPMVGAWSTGAPGWAEVTPFIAQPQYVGGFHSVPYTTTAAAAPVISVPEPPSWLLALPIVVVVVLGARR